MTFVGFCQGDSQTSDNRAVVATRPKRVWPWVLQDELVNRGADIFFRSDGIGGDVSGVPTTTLTTGLASSGETQIVLGAGGASWPASGTVLIDNEAITYSANGGASNGPLTIGSRAQSGTSAAAHTAGAEVRLLVGAHPTLGSTSLSTIAGPTGLTSRLDAAFAIETPDIAFINIHTNDASWNFQGIYQAKLQALIKCLKFRAAGAQPGNNPPIMVGATTTVLAPALFTVETPALLPAQGHVGDRYVVMSDNSSNGGQAAANHGDATTITTDLSAAPEQTVWEYRNPRSGTSGWGRIARSTTAPTHIQRIAVITTHYRNWATGLYDTPAAPYTAPAGQGANSQVNASIAAAVAAENVTVAGKPTVAMVDLYSFMRKRIVDGKDVDASVSGFTAATNWHQSDQNNHLNNYGHWLIAQAILDSTYGIPASWLTALGA